MKKVFKLSFVAASVLALAACNKEAPKAEVKLETEVQKQAYGLGASIGDFLKKDLEGKTEVGFVLDKELIVAGLEESLAGKSKLTEEEIKELLTKLNTEVAEKQQAAAQAKAEEVKAQGVAFLAENGKKDGVVTTDSGLQYQVLSEGEGKKPLATDTVEVHYKGTLIDGTEFDSSYSHGEPITFPLNRVIKGWTEGVQLMAEGSKYKFFIPSELAYGERDLGKIPANSTLIFEVELLKVVQPEAEKEAASE
ncbi:FKBP-type peptidyl-prolyl cis-trans isomerase [Pseudoalteromonas spongiae]|uniref:FKBP-type peptidyl-prolyl cis-trans isomerase n=1 Tax=Pseudoalteromonas spongiae TaxID=298657 RepID=UPI0037353368